MNRSSLGKLIASSAFFLLVVAPCLGQMPTDLAPQQAAMEKLSSLLGQWKGEGWIQMGPDQRMTYTIEESIEKKVGGTAFLVQGLGKTQGPEGQEKVIHEALAIISPTADSDAYHFQTHTGRGQHETSEIHLIENGFRWGFQTPRGEIRFTVTVKDGQWDEKGEISPDGESWYHFHQMSLKRLEE